MDRSHSDARMHAVWHIVAVHTSALIPVNLCGTHLIRALSRLALLGANLGGSRICTTR